MKKYTMILKYSWILLCIVALTMVRCTSQNSTNGSEGSDQQAKFDQDAKALQGKNDSTLKAIRAMDMKGLFQRLDIEAREMREPFNSLAYKELVKNRKDKGSELLAEAQQRQGGNYLHLLALRAIDPKSYTMLDTATKARVLVGALAQSKSYNLWGLPHLYWEEAAKAIVELGTAAKPGLKALLDDPSPAPVWGSEEALEYKMYMYRRSDYALALLMAIRGAKANDLPKSPAERDALIATEKNL